MNNSDVILSKSLRSAMEILKRIYKSADPDIKIQLGEAVEALSAAQSSVVEIQMAYQAIIDEKEKFRKQAEQARNWNEKASQYETFRLYSGATVMIRKKMHGNPYLADWYCKHCFENEKESQLHPDAVVPEVYSCPACQTPYTYTGRDQERLNQARSQGATQATQEGDV